MARPDILTPDEIAAWRIGPPAQTRSGAALAAALARHGLDSPAQCGGRNWPIGCVSLEITQRCNLDCSLCYLSDLSEAVHDVPIVEVFRRIEMIRAYFGPGTNVQVSGGDPTLRKRDELVAIVRRVAERGMIPALFTNGIKATRPLLEELAAAGLRDVAFHVDLTQRRQGYESEAALNQIRDSYIERTRGLGLRILFNTTVFDGNWGEMEDLARYFIARAEAVHLASFQLQAETGRGVLRQRGAAVTQAGMMDVLSRAAGTRLDFDVPLLGHPDCNRYTALWVAGGQAYPLFDDSGLFAKLFAAGAAARGDWRRRRVLRALAKTAARRPDLAIRAAGHAMRTLWRLRRGLIGARGRMAKISFMIHNFMDAEALERARCESCIFMAAGRDGPVSMCVYNARRDTELQRPLPAPDGGAWNPFTGRRSAAPCTATPIASPEDLPFKRRKGRLRLQAMEKRQAG